MIIDYWTLIQNLCIPFFCLVSGTLSMLNWKHELILAPGQSFHEWGKNDLLSSHLVHGSWHPDFINSFLDADSGIVEREWKTFLNYV